MFLLAKTQAKREIIKPLESHKPRLVLKLTQSLLILCAAKQRESWEVTTGYEFVINPVQKSIVEIIVVIV